MNKWVERDITRCLCRVALTIKSNKQQCFMQGGGEYAIGLRILIQSVDGRKLLFIPSNWTRQRNVYPSEPIGDAVNVALKIIQKYKIGTSIQKALSFQSTIKNKH